MSRVAVPLAKPCPVDYSSGVGRGHHPGCLRSSNHWKDPAMQWLRIGCTASEQIETPIRNALRKPLDVMTDAGVLIVGATGLVACGLGETNRSDRARKVVDLRRRVEVDAYAEVG